MNSVRITNLFFIKPRRTFELFHIIPESMLLYDNGTITIIQFRVLTLVLACINDFDSSKVAKSETMLR